MGFVRKTPAGSWRACWRDATGRQPSKTFKTKREATAFLAEVESTVNRGTYVDPHAGRRVPFDAYARRWLESRNHELATTARDASIMRTHLLPHWGSTPLARIDHSAVQHWVTDLGQRLAPASVAQCHRLMSGVLKAAVRDRLIAVNPCDGVRLPRQRRQAGADRLISREDFAERLLAAVPPRYRALVGLAGGTGLRWGECIGLRWDSVDLTASQVRVQRVAVEVAGHVTTKPYPKSRAGRRTVPLPPFVVELLKAHRETYGTGAAGEVFTNEAGGPIRRTLFRSRIWRPALVRAGLLGTVKEEGRRAFTAVWTDDDGTEHRETFTTHAQAVRHVARNAGGAPRFHDLRHSYATWLITAGVAINDVQRVMGHEQATTTLSIYTHVMGGVDDRVLGALAAFSLPPEPPETPEAPESDDSGASDQA
ncbi:MAG TPA: site-specific integrase [Kineosporiaceae bacterium]|nr:site-specific integrase [Kineosporiaceae bacterium]